MLPLPDVHHYRSLPGISCDGDALIHGPGVYRGFVRRPIKRTTSLRESRIRKRNG
jgi:hypothetical protein